MTQDEYDRCVRAIGWPDSQVRRAIGIPVLPTRKHIKPADFTPQQIRCCRFLAMNPEIRGWVERIKDAFPGAVMTAVRPVEPEPKA